MIATLADGLRTGIWSDSWPGPPIKTSREQHRERDLQLGVSAALADGLGKGTGCDCQHHLPMKASQRALQGEKCGVTTVPAEGQGSHLV